MFTGSWPRDLARAADLPLGVVENPRRLNVLSPFPRIEPARMAPMLLVIHGLRRQAQGDDAAFLADLRSGLALSRNLRNHSPLLMVLTSRAVESLLLDGVDRWLERLHGRPDLLREALALLRRHEVLVPDDPTDTQRAEFLMAENSLRHPEGFLTEILRNDHLRGEQYPVNPNSVAAVAVAWQVPWERERHQRLLRLQFSDRGRARDVVPDASPILGALRNFVSLSEQSDRDRLQKAEVRARQLEVALRLYQAEKGRPAAALDALVPEYLPEVPRDPFDSRPFRYRLSAGERIEWPDAAEKSRVVPAGQAILWSVGRDAADDGGVRHGESRRAETDTDLIFLVPLPPKK
jgi:hypothetical protein